MPDHFASFPKSLASAPDQLDLALCPQRRAASSRTRRSPLRATKRWVAPVCGRRSDARPSCPPQPPPPRALRRRRTATQSGPAPSRVDDRVPAGGGQRGVPQGHEQKRAGSGGHWRCVTLVSRGRLSPLADSLDGSLPNPSCGRWYACDCGHTRGNFGLQESLVRSRARVRSRTSGEASNMLPANSSTPAALNSSSRSDTVFSSPMMAASSGFL